MLHLDMDGVIVDFIAGICRLHGRPDPYQHHEHRGRWDIDGIWGMSPDEFWTPTSYYFWTNLDPTPDFAEFRKMPVVSIITSPSKTNREECELGKREWLRRYWPEMADRVIFSHDKHEHARPGHVLIDDSDRNIERWRAAGGTGILVPRPWNSLHAVHTHGLAEIQW